MQNLEQNEQQRPIGAIMARVSLEKQADKGYSLDVQVAVGRATNERHGLATDEQYILTDAGYSGDDWDRPAINRAIALIRARKISAVTFMNSDRFSRDVVGGLAIIKEIRAAGGRVIFGDMGEYTDESNFKLMLTIRMAIGEAEKTKIRALSVSGTAAKIRRGNFHGGRPPYGYKVVDMRLVEVPEQTAIVRQIFEWANAGFSTRAIVRELIARNITPSRKRWNACTVANILREDFYLSGIWYYNKRRAVEPDKDRLRKPDMDRHRKTTSQVYRDRAEWIPLGGDRAKDFQVTPVIPYELYARVSAKLAANLNTLRGKPSDRYRLKGLVYCKHCGHRFSGNISKGVTRYVCSHRDRTTGEALCDALSVRAAALEETVKAAALDTLGDEATLRNEIETHMAQVAQTENGITAGKMQARIEALRRAEFKARRGELFAEDAETIKLYHDEIKAAVGERRGLEMELQTLLGKSATGAADIDAIVAAVAALRNTDIEDAPAEWQEFMRVWIDKVVYADGEAEIHLRVPVAGEYCKHQQPDVSNIQAHITLKLIRRVA